MERRVFFLAAKKNNKYRQTYVSTAIANRLCEIFFRKWTKSMYHETEIKLSWYMFEYAHVHSIISVWI